jgi:hypothetical protein
MINIKTAKMLNILIGTILGYLLITSPQARRITGVLLSSAAKAISPETESNKPTSNTPKTKTNNIQFEAKQPNVK